MRLYRLICWEMLAVAALIGCSNPAPSAEALADAVGTTEPGVTGLLADESAQPLAGREILACTAAICYYGQSGADGRFRFEGLDAPADLVLKTQERVVAGTRWGAAMRPVQLVEDAVIDVGTVYVPMLPEGIEIDPRDTARRTFTAGDGLELTLRPADLSPPLGEIVERLAAHRIPPTHVPPYPGLEAEEVLAVYALHPCAATSESPIGVRVPSSLAAGTAVLFRTIDEIDGRLSQPVPGRATGTHLEINSSMGITRLTHVVISRATT